MSPEILRCGNVRTCPSLYVSPSASLPVAIISSKGPHYSVHLIFLEKKHLPTFMETERLCAFTGIHIICVYKINTCLNLVNCAVCLHIISVSAGGYYLRQTEDFRKIWQYFKYGFFNRLSISWGRGNRKIMSHMIQCMNRGMQM